MDKRVRIQNPPIRLDHVKGEIVAARCLAIPAEAVDLAGESESQRRAECPEKN